MQLKDNASYLVHGEFEVAHIAQRLGELEDSIWKLDTHRQAEGNGPHSKTNSIIINFCRGEPEFDKAQDLLNQEVDPEWLDKWALHNQLNRRAQINGTTWGGEGDLDTRCKPPWNIRMKTHFDEDFKNIKYRHVDEKLNAYTDEIVKQLEKQFNGVAGLVVYVRLPAKTVIDPHTDHGYYLSIVHRLHLPIVTNPKVNFNFTSKVTGTSTSVNMSQGILHEINNQDGHGVDNLGDEDRIHLIVDIIPRDKIPA